MSAELDPKRIANDALDVVRDGLQPGGPPVDYGELAALVCGDLSTAHAGIVKTKLARWRKWFDAFYEVKDTYATSEVLPDDSITGSPILKLARVIRQQIDARVIDYFTAQHEEYRNVRQIIDEVYRSVVGDQSLSQDDQLYFFRLAGQMIRRALEGHASNRLDQDDIDQTVAAGADETVVSAAETAPKRLLCQMANFNVLCEINATQADVYLLSQFAGRRRREIADLLSSPYDEVKKDLALATAEVER